MEDYDACECLEFNLSTLAFTVATKMVEGDDKEVFDVIPDKIRDAAVNIARVYQRDGEVVSLSSTGKAFHNELGARLQALLNASARSPLTASG